MAYSVIYNADGKPFEKANGKPRARLLDYWVKAGAEKAQQPTTRAMLAQAQARLSYDAASDSDQYARYWANADALDADSLNDLATRKKLRERSRYEAQSNGLYAGALKTYCDMLVGTGPKLRMLDESTDHNQRVETAWWAWCERVQLRRKLWCMAHAKLQDGEGFWILQNNPSLADDEVQLDILPIECDQVTTPYLPSLTRGYIDGLRFDPDTGEILWYDVLAEHPGGRYLFNNLQAIKVNPAQVIHWFSLLRPGQHRGIPACTSTLNVGANFRRWREATIKKAETQAAFTMFLETAFPPDQLDPVTPMDSMNIEHNMLTALPMGQRANQLQNNTPGAQFSEFHRSLVTEQSRPLSMPYNAAACDSSTYSFASGKLDTLCFRAGLNVDRCDCDYAVMDRVFAAWYREWALVTDRRRSVFTPPAHQWDWPPHPVIDDEGDARAKQMRLASGQTTFREVYSDAGRDYEDSLRTMAEDWFGDSSKESINKARQINLLRNVPESALPFVAQVLGIELPQKPATAPAPKPAM